MNFDFLSIGLIVSFILCMFLFAIFLNEKIEKRMKEIEKKVKELIIDNNIDTSKKISERFKILNKKINRVNSTKTFNKRKPFVKKNNEIEKPISFKNIIEGGKKDNMNIEKDLEDEAKEFIPEKIN